MVCIYVHMYPPVINQVKTVMSEIVELKVEFPNRQRWTLTDRVAAGLDSFQEPHLKRYSNRVCVSLAPEQQESLEFPARNLWPHRM